MNGLWKRCLAVMLSMTMVLGLGEENFLVYAQDNSSVQDEERGEPALAASEAESDVENELFSFESSVDGTENLVELSAGKSYYLQIMLDSEIGIDARYTVNFSNDSGDSFSVEKTDRRNTNTTSINGLWIPFSIPSEAYGKYEVSITVILANDKYAWNNEIIDVGISSEGTCGENLTWVLDSDGTLTISGTGEMYYFDETDSKEVPWKEMRQRIKSIVVGEGVTSIGNGAFDSGLPISSSRGSDSLKSVRMPDTITYIGSAAFARCNSLESISIPTGVKVINNSLFKKCKSLTSIEIPMGVTSIGAGAFDGCTRLENVIIPKGVTHIGSRAFFSCTKLANVEFPTGIVSIGDYAFGYCMSLTSLKIPEGFGSVYNGEHVFQDCTNLIYVETSSDVGGYYFQRCTKLKEVVLKDGVGKICSRAFEDCESLKNIEIADTVTEIENYVLSGCLQIEKIHLPKNVQVIGGLAFSGVQNIKLTVDSQSNFLTLKDDILFSKDLKKLIYYPSWKTDTIYQIPDSVIEICQGAFSENDSLEVVRMHGNLKKIDSWAFANCSALKYSVIPEGVERIEYYVYDSCPQLEYLVCPSSVISYGSGGLLPTLGVDRCENLKKVYGYSGSLAEEFFSDKFESVDNGVVLTFDAQGGAVSEQTRRVYPCHAYQSLPVPVKVGYVFAGWYTNEAGGEQVTDNSLVESVSDYTLHARWKNSASDVSTCKIALSDNHFSYTGNTIIPDIKVSDDDFVLTNGKEYTVSYSDNINAGEATITIKGIGTYTGTQIIHFTIEKATPTLKFASANVNKTLGDAAFTNKLTVSTDGTLTYTSSNPSVATVNKSSGLVTLKGTGTATITANAEEGENYTAKSESYELTVEQPAFVDLSSLTYSFGNSWNAFSYSSSYQIPLSSYQMVFSDVKARELYKEYKKKWGGSCFGMSVTSGIFNLKGSSMVVEDFNATANEVSDLRVSDINENLNVDLRSWIEAMHVSWYDPGIQKCWSNNVGPGSLDRMCETVKNGIPVVVYISGSGSAHAVVGYKVERKSSKETYLYVYDPNFPKKIRYLSLKTNSEGDYLGWYYHENDREDWGSDYSGKLSFITPDYYYGVWEASPGINQSAKLSGNMAAAQADQPESSSDDINMLIANSEDFIIQDDEGNTIAKVQDGQLFSDNTDIYQYQPLDPVEGDENILVYLPTDAYLIQNTDDSIDKLEMDMVNNDQRACVVTSADDIAFHVDDSKELNTVSIQADDGDSYEILLDSSLENAKNMEEIIVSGTATRNTIEVGMTKEGCMLKNCGEAKVKINGEELGSAAGSNQTDISKMEASLEYASCVYDGKNKEPEVVLQDGSSVLKNGTDYVVIYSNNIEPGTATATVYGIGRYTGKVKKNFTIIKSGEGSGEGISKVNIAQATITLSQNSYTYDGWQKKPLVTVKLNGKALKVDTDYMVIYSNNINIGTAKAIIIGKGNYTGNKSVNFTIVKASEGMDASITCKKTVYKVTYGAKPFKINATSKSTMSFISSNSKIATVDKNTGKVTIRGTGVVTITVKAGKNSLKVTVKVSPKKQSLKSVKASKGRKLAVKWAKDKNATGYQVQISEDKNFKKIAKQKNVTKNSYSFTKLKAGKKYYVRIRSYKKSGKETLYGAWSKVKRSGKVKK